MRRVNWHHKVLSNPVIYQHQHRNKTQSQAIHDDVQVDMKSICMTMAAKMWLALSPAEQNMLKKPGGYVKFLYDGLVCVLTPDTRDVSLSDGGR